MTEQVRQILVTGASRGIGRAITLKLASSGFSVWAGVRSQQAADDLADVASKRKIAISPIHLDVTSMESINESFAVIEKSPNKLYGLINNAGIVGSAFFEDYPDDLIRKIFDVNLFGAMNVTRRALPLLRANAAGKIIMISSIGGSASAAIVWRLTVPANSVWKASRSRCSSR